MVCSIPRHGRRPQKRDRVLEHLRGLIVSGQLCPGAQLPTHKELEAHFDAESPTIRAAMEILGTEGFVETRHRRGTFVAQHPPHLSQFAFVFPFPSFQSESQFFFAICAEATRCQSRERQVLPFFDIHEHTDVPDYQRLLGLVQTHCLGGLVFAANPYGLRKMRSPLTEMPGVSRVVIEAGVDVGGVPAVYPDTAGLCPKAFAHLAARGCRRVAVVSTPNTGFAAELSRLQAAASAEGLVLAPEWLQGALPAHGAWLQQIPRLLLRGSPEERPDGLVITDDNLVPEVTAGIAATRVRVAAADEARTPGDLVVAAHANFPHPTASAVPVMRLGYDMTRLVSLCLERIAQQRRGETPPAQTLVPVLFAHEHAGQPTDRTDHPGTLAAPARHTRRNRR